MRWWSSSTNTCGFCTVLLSRTTSPCLFLHRFLSPSLLSSQEFFCQHMSFSLRVSDEHIGPISTAEEPHFNAQWEIDPLPCCFIAWQFILWICWCDMPTWEGKEHNLEGAMFPGDISAVVDQCIAFDLTELYQLRQERVWITGLLGRKESTWSLCGYCGSISTKYLHK